MKRQKDIDRFNDPNSEEFIYLLTTRAGGVGINLATADTVIIFDPDFNPHMDLQAISRSHRYGQTKRVLVFKLMTGIEEQIINKGKKKMVLDHLVVQQLNKETEEGEVDNLILYGVQEIRKEAEQAEDTTQRWTKEKIDDLIDGAEREAEEMAKREAEEEGVAKAASESEVGTEDEGRKKSKGSMGFSFARIWETKDKGGLKDVEDAEDEVELDDNMWAAFVAEREAEEAKRREAGEAEAGRRRRAAKLAINYSLFDQSPQKPKKGKGKKDSRPAAAVPASSAASDVEDAILDFPDNASDTDYIAPDGPPSDGEDDEFDLLPDNTDDLSYELERHYAGIVSGKPHLTKAEKRALRQQRARELSLQPPPDAPGSSTQPQAPSGPAQHIQGPQQQRPVVAYDAVVAEQFISRARIVLRTLHSELRIAERTDLQKFWDALCSLVIDKNQRFISYSRLAQQADSVRESKNDRKRYTLRDTCLLVWEFIRSNAVLYQQGPQPLMTHQPLSRDARLQLQIGARPPLLEQQEMGVHTDPRLHQQSYRRNTQLQLQLQGEERLRQQQMQTQMQQPQVLRQQYQHQQFQQQQMPQELQQPQLLQRHMHQQPLHSQHPHPGVAYPSNQHVTPYAPPVTQLPPPGNSLAAEQHSHLRAHHQAQQRYLQFQALHRGQQSQQHQTLPSLQAPAQTFSLAAQQEMHQRSHHQAQQRYLELQQTWQQQQHEQRPSELAPSAHLLQPDSVPRGTSNVTPSSAPTAAQTPQRQVRNSTPISVPDSPSQASASDSTSAKKQRISLSGRSRPSGAQPTTTPSALQLGDSSRFDPTVIDGAVDVDSHGDSACMLCGQHHALDDCPKLVPRELLDDMARVIENMRESEDKVSP